MIYIRTPITFRISEWPRAGAVHHSLFTRDKLQYNLIPLVDYLSKTLYDIGRAFVYRTSFTITNVVSPISGLSYGLNDKPHYRLMRLHPITLTFAFTTRQRYVGILRPKFSLRPYPYVTMWGDTLRTSADYLTINVPRSVMREVGISVFNTRELAWLYHFVGAFTKGFVNRCEYYDPNQYIFRPITNNKQSILHVSLPTLFQQFEYADWIYSDRAWDMMPNVLHVNSADDTFCAFYCKYLRKWYKQYKIPNVIEIEKRIYDYVHGQVLLCLQNGSDVDGVITTMAEGNYRLPDMSQVELYVSRLLEPNK